MKILKITRDKHVKERFYLKIEGMDSLIVSAETIVKYGLAVGKEVDAEYLASLIKEDEKKRAVDASFNLLSYTQRSRKELSGRLKLKKFSQAAIEHALARLTELGYLNDTVFARNLLQIRRAQAKGDELIRFEMKRKGISNDIINETLRENRVSPQAEAELILPMARKKLKLMSKSSKGAAPAQRLMGFLARRGYSVETTRNVLRLLRQELSSESESFDD